MAEPTLTEVFGAGARQDEATLTIAKADLATVGLTPSANNSAESQIVAILLLAKINLTTTRQESNPEQSVTIDDGFGSEQLVPRNNNTYRHN